LKRNNYDKIQRPGGTAVLTIGQFIPKDWRMVRVVPIQPQSLTVPEELQPAEPENVIYLRLERVV